MTANRSDPLERPPAESLDNAQRSAPRLVHMNSSAFYDSENKGAIDILSRY